jgi:hypothetical protein
MLRRLREIIGQYWEKVRPPGLNDLGHAEATPLSPDERLWNAMIDAGGCVECAAKPKFLVEGPSGGMSQNVFCAHCGQGYNLIPVGHWAQKIHVDKGYCDARPTAH